MFHNLIDLLFSDFDAKLSVGDFQEVVQHMKGYSGRDLTGLKNKLHQLRWPMLEGPNYFKKVRKSK